ncbi:MAG: MurT ligase domain-containing protein [Dehalococcoidia bacterium]
MNPRTWAAIAAGRMAGTASRALGRGGGTAVAGLAALHIDPALPAHLASTLGRGCAIVTGTNGKTTTARMLASMASEAALRPLANPSGSNLMRGIATALIESADLAGRVRDASQRLGVFEVDEATLPEAARALTPRAIVFTNLFRDQLDRYGEVDTVAMLWRQTLEMLSPETTLVLNADDPAVASLAQSAKGRVVTYGIEDTRVAQEHVEHASDYRFCLSCGAELAYSAAFFGHIGHWRCPSCNRARPAPDVRAISVELHALDSTGLVIETPSGDPSTSLRTGLRLELPLAGLYNVENALAATAGALALGLPLDAVERGLRSFRAAFGRQERFQLDGRDVLVLLGKNPTGMNQVLRTITSAGGELRLLLFLNDGIADGRDISWIWDTDYELIAERAASVVVSGTRADEMALRLKYADLRVELKVVRETEPALSVALEATPPGETLYVIPTYTAMLEVRELLARKGGKERFWQEGSRE